MKIMLTRSSTKELIDIDTDNVEECYQNRHGTTVIKLKDSVHCIPISEGFNEALQLIYRIPKDKPMPKIDDTINEFTLMLGAKLTLFKHPNGRLNVVMTDYDPLDPSDSGSIVRDNMLEREALVLRDALNEMYPLDLTDGQSNGYKPSFGALNIIKSTSKK